MGEQSFNNFKNNSQPNKNRGGETKVMKKILNALLVFALLLTMVTPAFAADLTTEAKFDALKEAGILDGNADGTMGLSDNLSRAALAKVAVNLAGVEAQPGAASDFEEPQVHWGYTQGWIQAAVDAGLMVGGDVNGKKKFRPSDLVTFEEMVITLVRSLDLEKEVKVIADVDGKVSTWARGYVALALENGLISAQEDYTKAATRADLVAQSYLTYDAKVKAALAVESVNVVDASNLEVTFNDGVTVAYELVEALEANVATDVTFDYEGKSFTAEVTYEYTLVGVESVTADNLMEAVVKFNKPVDEDSAEDKSNYKLDGASLHANDIVTLQDDAQTVVINFKGTTALTNQQEYELTVDNVKDLDENVMDKTDVKFTPVDTTIPQVVSVEVTGPQDFKVNYSEPVDPANKGTFKIDGGRYYASPTMSNDNKSIELHVGVKLSEGEHTVTVENTQDFQGFKVSKTELAFEVVTDSAAPVVVVDKTTETKVTLKFDKDVKAVNLNTDVTAYYGYNDNASYKGTIAAKDPVNGYSDTYEVTFTNPIPAGTHTLYLNTKTDKLQDKWGNDVADTELTFSVEIDNAKPEVVKVEAAEDDKLEVTFSEDVNLYDATKRAYYTLKDANGDVVKTADFADVDNNGHFNSNATLSYDSDDYVVTIDLTNNLTGGYYYLAVEDVRDVSYSQNKLEDVELGFEVSDTTGPALSSVIVNSTGSKIRVSFDEPMNAAGLTDVKNYRLSVDSASFAALPDRSSITIVDSKTVEITLGTADANVDGTNDAIQIAGSLMDVFGNEVGGFYAQTAITNDTVGVATFGTGTDKVRAVAKDTLEVMIDKELSGIDASLISVTATAADATSASVASAYFTNDNGEAKVTIILDKDLATSPTIADVTFNANALESVFGTNNAQIIVNTNIVDKIAPEIDTVATASTTSIDVTFTEAINTDTVSIYSFGVADNTVTAIAWNTNVLTLTLDDAITTGATPAVSQLTDVKDLLGNVLVAGSDVASTDDGVAPTATALANGTTTYTIADGASATIEFSETLDSASETAVETAIANSLDFAWSGSTLVITNTTGSAVSFTTSDVVANISDGTNTTTNAVLIDVTP